MPNPKPAVEVVHEGWDGFTVIVTNALSTNEAVELAAQLVEEMDVELAHLINVYDKNPHAVEIKYAY